MDPKEKQELMDSLKQSAYKISKQVEAEKDSFRIVISSSGIQQYYKNMPIITVKAENLSSKAAELINKNPEIAATTLLEQFSQEFDAASFEKKAASGMDVKTAANETLDEMTWQMVTQKQLDEQKVNIHPRVDEYPNKVTDKQIVEDGQRVGTYDITTEGQLRDERNDFYGRPRITGDWKSEDRNIVTEGQLEKGAKEYSDVGTSDRNQMGAKFDGGPEKQSKMTGEKQLAELLKHHKWTEPLTTTEGKDQLGQQDGELSRITAEVANKIVKEALSALGKTVVAAGVTPNDLAGIVAQLVSHDSKLPVLANIIREYANQDVSAIDRKIAKAKHFGKFANAGADWSDELIADVVVRQLGKMAYSPRIIVEALSALAEGDDFASRINAAVDEVLKSDVKVAGNSNKNIFKQVLAGEQTTIVGDDNDGRYAYHGVASEVNADINDEAAFGKAAAEFAKKQTIAQVGKELELIEDSIQIDKVAGEFCVQLVTAEAKDLQVRAAARRQKVKEAQMGGMGGMASPAGDQMGNPAPPAGPADMGAPPGGESLTQEPVIPEEEEGGAGEPKPPGTICGACGSEDVDIDNGTLRCNNCNAEGTISIKMEWTKYPGTLEDSDKEEKGGFALGSENEAGLPDEQEEAAASGGATMPNVPVGASVRVTPFMIEKLSSQGITLGSVCPNCGSKETNSIKSASTGSDSVCWECGQSYHTTLKATKGKKNSLVMETVWVPKTASSTNCTNCTRLHKSFVKSLRDYGMTWEAFDRLAMKDQAQVVVKMANSGTLDLNSAMNAALPIHKFAASTKKSGNFPMATCRERLARRFGENATAMSGSCQGKPLSECVCTQLASLNIYSDSLAAKVASAMSSQDPMLNNPVETCVKMLANEGMALKEACVACDGLRAAYASTEDLVIETIAQADFGLARPAKPMQGPMGMNPARMNPSPNPMPAAKPMVAPAKPLDGVADPQDEVVTDDMGGMGEMGHEMGEMGGMGDGMGSEMGGMNEEMGGMGNMGNMSLEVDAHPDTVSLLMDIAEDFSQLAKALVGDIDDTMTEPSEGDEQVDDSFGGDSDGNELDGSLDVSDVTDDVVDDNNGDGDDDGDDNGPGGLPGHDESEESSDLPPGVDESTDGGLEKNSKPCSKPMPGESKDCGQKCNKPMEEKKPAMAASNKMTKEASTREFTPEQRELDALLNSMKKGSIKKSAEALDSVFESLMKIAAKSEVKKVEYKDATEGTKVTAKPAQDADGFGKIKDGGKIGHEEPFSKGVSTKPDVPRGEALMGDEGKDLTVSETGDLPKVPRGKANLEGEDIYKSDKNNNVDGNQGGTKSAKGRPAQKKAQGVLSPEAPAPPPAPTNETTTFNTTSQLPEPQVGETGELGGDVAARIQQIVDNLKQDPELDDSDIVVQAVADAVEQGLPLEEVHDFLTEKGLLQVTPDQFAKDESSDAFSAAESTEHPYDIENDPMRNKSVAPGKESLGSPLTEPAMVASQKGTNMKTAKVVNPTHKIYGKLVQKIANGETSVKLTDDNVYEMQIDEKKNVILAQKTKESQTVSLKVKKSLEDDPDINQTSGPGKGKVKSDKAHSLAVDEKKPSEGMSEPSVPKAPNGGRLQREHTVEKAKDGPNIPAGGGSNPEYDTVEKYSPEKLDETLGKDRGLGAVAENHELAVKIAGKLLKANKITVDELPNTIDELSKKSVAEILDTFEGAVKTAETTEGIQKTAATQVVESLPAAVTNVKGEQEGKNLRGSIQGLFTLNQRNEDYARYSQDKEARLWH